jgi:hypothetical protein
MKVFLTIAAAGLFALSTIGGALAECAGHAPKTAEISTPVNKAEAPVVTPKPEG